MMQQSSCERGLQQGRHQRNCSQSWPLFARVYKHAARGPAQHLSHLSFAEVARYHVLQDACSSVQRRPEVNAGGGGSMLENMPQPSNPACGALAELPTARLACSRRVAGADGDVQMSRVRNEIVFFPRFLDGDELRGLPSGRGAAPEAGEGDKANAPPCSAAALAGREC